MNDSTIPADSDADVDADTGAAEALAQVDEPYPSEVRILEQDGRRYVLVGTAHVAKASVDLVRLVIEKERPDCVCVELDPRRYEALSKEEAWDQLDLRQVIRQNQLSTLLLNLILASYQKKIGQELGIKPGTELLEATRVAASLDIPFELCDRDVRITLRRAIAGTPFLRRLLIMSELLASMFDAPEITEKDLEDLRQQDVLSDLMEEMGRQHPNLKKVLIDERDAYLCERLRRAPGKTLVAVVGAGHLKGMEKALEAHQPIDLEALDAIPPSSKIWPWVGWSVPILIVGSLFYIGFEKGLAQAGDNLLVWALAGSIPSTLGAILALSHPLTILSAFVAAPFCILSPLIGTAHVTAFVQAWVEPPRVAELHNVTDEVGKIGRWWRNRVLRVFLAYILPGIGSLIGSILGFSHLMSALF